MGESAAQTVKEIEDVRDRLDRSLGELQSRLPAPAAAAKRLIGIAVGGGVGGSVFWFALRRIRSKRREASAAKTARESAVAKARSLTSHARSTDPDDDAAPGWPAWAAVGAAVWIGMRFAELRQLKKQTKLLAGRS